ncbi:MAG: hypothetical protein GY714_12470 [Desulfobacterales bacterium]|nr:hypothetical protein [Desulfobacterales bacterium]
MKLFYKLILLSTFLLLIGCSSPYNYYNSPYPLEQSQKFEKAEALNKLFKLISSYQENEKFIFAITGLTPQSRLYNDKVENKDIGTKYKFRKVTVDNNIIGLVYSNKKCDNNECLKRILFKIDTKKVPTLCKVKRVHKETKAESFLYRLYFPFYVGYVNPADGKEMIVDAYDGLNLNNKKEMDQIVDLLRSIYSPKFTCK